MKLRLSKEWFERQSKKEEGEASVGRIDSKNMIRCGCCYSNFETEYPRTGESVTCSNCKADGYGTYEDGLYSVEWLEHEK